LSAQAERGCSVYVTSVHPKQFPSKLSDGPLLGISASLPKQERAQLQVNPYSEPFTFHHALVRSPSRITADRMHCGRLRKQSLIHYLLRGVLR